MDVWEGQIPLCVSLAEDSSASSPPPEPVFVLAPRGTYLPLLVEQLVAHFGAALPPGCGDAWFSLRGVPLRWQFEVGVLHSLLANDEPLPLQLTLHFRGFPEAVLARCAGAGAVRSTFFNALKEAAFLSCGTATGVMTLASSAQADLWHGIAMNDWTRFSRGRSALQASLQASRRDKASRVAVRLHVRHFKDGGARPWSDVVSSSHAVAEQHATLRSFVDSVVVSVANETVVLVQGVTPPWDARLSILHEQTCSPDGFLHVVLIAP